jgi:hypothetical protein
VYDVVEVVVPSKYGGETAVNVKLQGESTKQFKRDELYTFEDIVGM